MSLQDQQKRYMKLTGEPLRTSFARAALTSPMAKACGLSMIFNLTTVTGGGLTNTALSLSASALTFMLTYGLFQGIDHFLLKHKFGGNGDTLCIDTTPERNARPTSLFHKESARKIRKDDAIYLAPIGLLAVFSSMLNSAVTTIPDLSIPPNVSLSLSTGGTIAWCLLGHYGHSFHRFNKVVHDEWVITDVPVPEKKAENITKPVLNPL